MLSRIPPTVYAELSSEAAMVRPLLGYYLIQGNL